MAISSSNVEAGIHLLASKIFQDIKIRVGTLIKKSRGRKKAMLLVNNSPQQLDFELPAIIQNDQSLSEADKLSIRTTARDSMRAAWPSIKASQVEEINESLHYRTLQKEFITRLASRITQSEQERVSFVGPSGRQPFIPSEQDLLAIAEIHCSEAAVEGMRAQFIYENSSTEEGEISKVQRQTILSFADNTDQPPLGVCSFTNPLYSSLETPTDKGGIIVDGSRRPSTRRERGREAQKARQALQALNRQKAQHSAGKTGETAATKPAKTRPTSRKSVIARKETDPAQTEIVGVNNIAKIKIPHRILYTLSLGLKYSPHLPIDPKEIYREYDNAIGQITKIFV